MTSASLIEIFASAQGEGPEIGRRTVFVRFGGCDLRCRWCDSPGTWRTRADCRVEEGMGTGVFKTLDNPVPAQVVADWVDRLGPDASTWVSLTGGEPLLQPAAIGALIDELSGRGRRIYLETHGLHHEALAQVVSRVDLVSMDWKFASEVAWAKGAEGAKKAQEEGLAAAGAAPNFGAAHEAFAAVAQKAGAMYVKAVLTPSTTTEEFDDMLTRIARISEETPLVLQPVTPAGGVESMPSAEALLGWLARAESVLRDVRLIPQTHPIYGAL